MCCKIALSWTLWPLVFLAVKQATGIHTDDEDCQAAETSFLQTQAGLGGHLGPVVSSSASDVPEATMQVSWHLVGILTQLCLPLALALVLCSLRGGVAQRCPRTAALNGFSFLAVLGVFAQHVELQLLSWDGCLLVLCGCLLSLARRPPTEPGAQPLPNLCEGGSKFLLYSPKAALQWMLLRVARVCPVYWLALSLEDVWDGQVAGADWILNPFHLISMCASTLVRIAVHEPRRLFLLLGVPGSTVPTFWVLHVVVVVYLFSPFLEFCLLRPIWTQRGLLTMAGLCITAKMVVIAFAVVILNDGGFEKDPWYRHAFLGLEVPWYSFALFRLPEVALGMLIPYFAADAPGLVTAADVLAAVVLVFTFLPQTPLTYLCSDMNLQCPVTAWIVWALCFGPRKSMLGELLSSNFLVQLGNVSYGFYVFQQPVLQTVGLFYPSSGGKSGGKSLLDIVLTVVTLLLLGWLSRHVVEEPSKWFARKLLGLEPSTVPFQRRWLQAADVFRSMVQMIVYAWPITLSLDLVATWQFGATASGFFLSWDQIGNVLGLLVGHLLGNASYDFRRRLIILCPLFAGGFSLLMPHMLHLGGTRGYTAGLILRFLVGLLQGSCITNSAITRLLTPRDEQVGLSMFVNFSWTGGVVMGAGLPWVISTLCKLSEISPPVSAMDRSCACAVACGGLLMLVSCMNAVSLPVSMEGLPTYEEHTHEDAEEATVTAESKPGKLPNSWITLTGLFCQFLGSVGYTGVEVSSSLLLEVQFSWGIDAVSLGVSVVYMVAAFGSLLMFQLRENLNISDNLLVVVMSIAGLIGSLSFYDFINGPYILLIGSGIIYPCMICCVGIAEGNTFLHAKDGTWRSMENLVTLSYLTDAWSKSISPPVTRGMLEAFGPNVFATYQLLVLSFQWYALEKVLHAA
ncbi:unnamed protein product [Symbiodinium microadriaticum]|nr:unnamed protein product [Symbiodinium microadriaticum]CAE7947408.1 unnamed protein product [Symbiodinium sp. KB8]